jgi:glycosyltransferase involved in cell wall biosynthesis
MRHIVIISQIPFWSMGKDVGGPAFTETITHLSKRFRISLVQPRSAHVDAADLPANIELHTFEHRFHGLWRDVRKLGWVTDTLGWYSFTGSAWPIVRELCAKGDVDAVYGYEIYGTPVARRAAREFGLPMIARFQGTLMSTRQHMRLSTLRFWKHVRGLSEPADLIVMTNDGTLGRDYLMSLGQPAERIKFWMNGVDRAIADVPRHDVRQELDIPSDVHMLLTVSRLSGWKRVDRAIGVVAGLAAQHVDARLVIVGTGSQEARLREIAAALGVSERVVFAGAVAREELASYYGSADLLLSLYDYSNLGNPAIEAMLLGVPLLAYDVGGTRDLVKDGINGVLIADADDATALASRVRTLLADPAALRALGDAAAMWARSNLWTWDERISAEADAIDALIDAHDAADNGERTSAERS